jgi:hypothetical protein
MVLMITNNKSFESFKTFLSLISCAFTIPSIPNAHNKQFVEELDGSINSTIANSHNNDVGKTFTHEQFLNYL